MTQAPTPGPLSGDDVKLLVKGDWLLPTLSGATPKQFDHVGSTVRNTPLLFFVDGGSCLASVANFIGRPDADGWVPWSGGENPVPGQRVEIRCRDGIVKRDLSSIFAWSHSSSHDDRHSDIIVFRLAPTASVEASGSEREDAWRVTYGDGSGALFFLEEEADESIEEANMGGVKERMILSALRPQPSGETREAAGCAEPQVGRAVYERIEKLLTTAPQGWECDYLCHLVESVEELGGYDGPRLDRRDDRQAVADFLKLRDESVGHSEVDDAERLESADAILALLSTRPLALGGQQGEVLYRVGEFIGNRPVLCQHGNIDPNNLCAYCEGEEAYPGRSDTTPARAEAQDEGAVGESLDDVVRRLLAAQYPGRDYDDLKDMVQIGWLRKANDEILSARAHPSPTPAADDDRVRMPEKWFEVAEYAAERGLTVHESKMRLEEFQRVVTPQAIAALKSTAAKEGGAK